METSSVLELESG